MVFKFVIAHTQYGPVKGITKSSVLAREYVSFQGIPYMKPPLGNLRFRDAQPPVPWVEPFDATEESHGYVCPDVFIPKIAGREDASIINIFTHDVNPKVLKPVMVFIHGGGFMMGSGCTDAYGPDYILQKDVILVTFNYRLGVSGFLSLDDPALGVPGNAGLKDQTFALKWVQRNIENFGGDPNNVTIMGESAGAGSCHYHMITEASRGLFHKAILMSGSAFNKSWSCIPRRDWAARLARSLGYEGSLADKDILEFLEGCDATDFIACLFTTTTPEEILKEHIFGGFLPCIEPYESENCFIPKDPVLMAREAWGNDIPCIIGGTSFEGMCNAALISEAGVSIIRDPISFAPLLDLGLDAECQKAKEYGMRIKKVYYGLLEPSLSNIEPYLHFISDMNFWHGMQRAILSRVSCGGAATYFYRFDCQTELNFMKKHFKAKDYEGASHADDLNYLFKHNGAFPAAHPKIDSIEFEMITKMVALFTSFAITGNPTAIQSIIWDPVTSIDHPLACLSISEKQQSMMPLPETERLEVWDSVYRDEGVPLY